jgi:hypothetical protein
VPELGNDSAASAMITTAIGSGIALPLIVINSHGRLSADPRRSVFGVPFPRASVADGNSPNRLR